MALSELLSPLAQGRGLKLGAFGRLHRLRVARGQHAGRGVTYYVCGPQPFLHAFVSGLARCGVPLHRIRYEYFPARQLFISPPPK